MRFKKPRGYKETIIKSPKGAIKERAGSMSREVVVEARRRAAKGETSLALAGEYGVSHSALNKAIIGKTYRYLNALASPVRANRRWYKVEIELIFDLYARGFTKVEIAGRFDTTVPRISWILERKHSVLKDADLDLPSRIQKTTFTKNSDRLLTEEQVIQIRHMWLVEKRSTHRIIKTLDLPVGPDSVRLAARGFNYKEVPFPSGVTPEYAANCAAPPEERGTQLTLQQVRELRRDYSDGMSQNKLRARYHVSAARLMKIINGEEYPDIN